MSVFHLSYQRKAQKSSTVLSQIFKLAFGKCVDTKVCEDLNPYRYKIGYFISSINKFQTPKDTIQHSNDHIHNLLTNHQSKFLSAKSSGLNHLISNDTEDFLSVFSWGYSQVVAGNLVKQK